MSNDLRKECGDAPEAGPVSHHEQLVLLSKAQSGDNQAFLALIEPHLHRIYRMVVQITRNHEDAEDACQESILKAFIHLEGFQGSAQFSTWLTRIAINEALMSIRKLQAEARHRCDGSDTREAPVSLTGRDRGNIHDPEELCAEGERKALLWEAINHLETNSRTAICQLGLEEKATGETAEEFGLSRSGMRSRFQRALRKLRAMLAGRLKTRREQIQGLA